MSSSSESNALTLATLADKIDAASAALYQEVADALRKAQEQRQPVLRFCHRLIAVIRAVLDEKEASIPGSGWQAVVFSILTKMLSTVRAAHTLASAGHGREVPILGRSALEALITALFIAKEDSACRAERWAQHAKLQKARLLKKYPNLSSTPEYKEVGATLLAHAEELESLNLFPDPRFWASGLHKGSLRDLAEDVGMLWHYDMIYWSGSQDTHASAIGVAKYVAMDMPIYNLALSSADVPAVRAELVACCELLARALDLLNGCCNLGLAKILEELSTEYAAALGPMA